MDDAELTALAASGGDVLKLIGEWPFHPTNMMICSSQP